MPTTLYHWDGSSWSPFTLPLVAGEATELSASSPTNVWVVGASHPCLASPCSYSPPRWQIIDASRDLLTESPLVTDGASGAWMGPYAHWTGNQWVNTEPFSPVTCGLADLTRIPGTATLWGVGGAYRSAKRSDSVICAYPKTP